jgi:hypothetical protein
MAVLSPRARRGGYAGTGGRRGRSRLAAIDWILWGVPLGLTLVVLLATAVRRRLAADATEPAE